jgi:hypothetical protein
MAPHISIERAATAPGLLAISTELLTALETLAPPPRPGYRQPGISLTEYTVALVFLAFLDAAWDREGSALARRRPITMTVEY